MYTIHNKAHNTQENSPSHSSKSITTFYAQNWDGDCLFSSPILIGTNDLEALACSLGTLYRRPDGRRWYWLYNGCVLSLVMALPFLSTRVSYIDVILSSRTPAILLDTLMILWSLFLLTNDSEPYQEIKQMVTALSTKDYFLSLRIKCSLCWPFL